MKIQLTILTVLSGGALFAQAPEAKTNIAYQQVRVMADAGAGKQFFFKTIDEGRDSGPPVKGKPLSATETHRSLQVLGDGTRIENSDSDTFYRDEEGRTRTERGPAGGGSVVIHDPVAGFTVILDPEQKTAHKIGNGATWISKTHLPPPPPDGAAHPGIATRMAVVTNDNINGNIMIRRSEIHTGEAVTEDLGTQTINGVPAKGTRATETIPAGQIGNDRPIQVVNERWQSTDLQMLVKSSNNDPRFGETTYELSNINRAAPAATLFQIPSDYTMEDSEFKKP